MLTQWTLDVGHDLLLGKDEATLRTMVATPRDVLVIPPFWLRLYEIPPRIFSETDYRERGLLLWRIIPAILLQRKLGQIAVTSSFSTSFFGQHLKKRV